MSNASLIWPMMFQASLTIVLVFGSIGLALGVGLLTSGARTMRFLHSMNRWVSLRGALKTVEIPRDTDQLAHKYRYWVGIPLVVGGLFACYGLATRISAADVGAAFARGTMAQLLTIAAEASRWFLIFGSICGVVIGVLLCYSPELLSGFEKYANKWVSPRRLARGGDDMHLTLDKLVETHPRQSGWIFVCTSLGVVVYAAMLLLTRH